METDINTGKIEETQIRMQYILDENGKLIEIPKDRCMPVEHPIKYRLRNAFEVFVRVKDTENYWISNYGRCVNNLTHKDKNTFFKHKEGKCHYTVFGIDRYIIRYPSTKKKRKKSNNVREKVVQHFVNTSEDECKRILEELQKADEKNTYVLKSDRYRIETSPDKLVADTFLKSYSKRVRIWHKDGDENNNWYKNLLTVTEQDYADLKTGKVSWQELNLEQEYIEYENKASAQVYKVYNGIYKRCQDTKNNDSIRACYDKSTMWQGWIDNPKSFVKWYLEHYYEVEDEQMDVDKDLFGDGSGMYHPDFCCILPKGLNALLANSKKHYSNNEDKSEETLPFGVKYNSKSKKYYSEISFKGDDRKILLSEWDTPEEAFEEYKTMKKSYLNLMAVKYKSKIPDYIYKKLLEVEIKPY